MINFFCKAVAIAGVECDTPVSYEVQQGFMQHMAEFGLSYGTKEEFNFRLKQFSTLDSELKEINESQDSYKVGHNKFSTWTSTEKKRLLGFKGLEAGID